MRKRILVLAMVFMISLPVIAFAADVTLTSDGKVPGTPFQALQQQIDQLKTQLQNIQLTPGPPGPTGATGAGIQGIAGVQGIQGIQGLAGISFDLSKLYTNESHYAPATCNNDDVSISCTARCSTHPNYDAHGVPEEVVNFEFGLYYTPGCPDCPAHPYVYEDQKPGLCLSKCVVPYSPLTAPWMLDTYNAHVKVLCMPRD